MVVDNSESVEHVAHPDSDCNSLLSGSTVCDNLVPSPEAKDKVNSTGAMDVEADMESLPEYSEYEPRTSRIEKDLLLADESRLGHQHEDQRRCSRRGCLGRGRCRRASTTTTCERKRRLRRRFAWIAVLVKAMLIFGLFTFLTRRVCMKHRKGASLPDFSDHSWEKVQNGQREIVLNKGSQAVVGRYPLYDLLHIKTTSGSVSILVDPQPADPKKPDEPARLIIETEAGAVSVAFLESKVDTMATFENGDTRKVSDVIDLDYLKTSGATSITQIQAPIPYRPYQVEIRTQSGDITGEVLFTSSAHLKTQSGRIAAHFTPVLSHDHDESVVVHAVLTTHTESGAQDISFAEPLVIDNDDSSRMYYPVGAGLASSSNTVASHTSQSGNVVAKYPRSWAGRVEASTSSGWIAMGGRGLNVTEEGKGHAVGVKAPEHDNHAAHHHHHDADDGDYGDDEMMMTVKRKKDLEWWGSRGDMTVNLESTGSGSIQFYVKDRFLPHSMDEPDDFEAYIIRDRDD